jgi:hypothetical protein
VTEYRIQGKDGAELLLTCSPDDNVFVQYTAPDGAPSAMMMATVDIQAQTDSRDTYSINDTPRMPVA